MQPKFGNKKKNKNQLKKAAKKRAAAAKALGGDVAMVDSAKEAEIDYTIPDADGATAKSRQRGKMQLKVALKAKVKLLKHTRSKLTKLQGSAKMLEVKKELKKAKAGIKSSERKVTECANASSDVTVMEQ